MKHSLEEQKAFPYIAWATFIGFALFTYSLTINLNKELESSLGTKVEAMDTAVNEGLE